MPETATTTPCDDAFPARGDLQRAYAGILSVDCLVRATDAAAAHAQQHQRRLRRLENPVGYLFRVGRDSLEGDEIGADDRSWRGAAATGVSEALLHEPLLKYLRALPRTHQDVVWLVRSCGWTNVQAGEALGLSPAAVADAVSGGGRVLCGSLGVSHSELGRRLSALADARVALLPELAQGVEDTDGAPTASVPSEDGSVGGSAPLPPDQPAGSETPTRWGRLSDPRVVVGAVIAALAFGGGAILVSALRSPENTPRADPSPTVAPIADMGRRAVVEEQAWARSVSERSVAGTFALATVGDGSAVRTADSSRAARPITLANGQQTSVVEQLDAMETVDAATLPVEEGDGWLVAYQTGTGEVDGKAVAWTTGVVVVGRDRFVFAHNADLELASGDAVALPVQARLTAVVEFLRLGGVLPAA